MFIDFSLHTRPKGKIMHGLINIIPMSLYYYFIDDKKEKETSS